MSEEELFPKTTRFEDGSAIIAYGLSNEKFIVTHGDKQYGIKSISTSNYAKKGGTIKTEPAYSIVVEHPYKTVVNPDDLQDYVVEFVGEDDNNSLKSLFFMFFVGRVLLA